MFVWWLAKKVWAWVNYEDRSETIFVTMLIGAPIIELLVNIMVFGTKAGSGKALWFPLSTIVWVLFISMSARLMIDVICVSLLNLHSQYRAEVGDIEKPKRKRDDYRDKDASIESYFDGYDTATKYIDNLFMDESDGGE